MPTRQFQVIGLTYGGCATTVERALRARGGIRNLSVSFATREATARFDEQITSPEKFKLAVMSAGYQCEVDGNARPAVRQALRHRTHLTSNRN